MHSLLRTLPTLALLTPLLAGCDREPVVEGLDVEGWSGQCVSLRQDKRWLVPGEGSYTWERGAEDQAARFRLQAADLGVYLLFDEAEQYLIANTELVTREPSLQSELSRIVGGVIDETFISGGEWALEPSSRGGERYQLHNRRNDAWLGRDGLVMEEGDALAITLEPAVGCAVFPELSLDAAGSITKTTFDDGTLYGIVDAHSHLLSNLSFGGGIYHGAAFHRPVSYTHLTLPTNREV